jgi:hypothetical protein
VSTCARIVLSASYTYNQTRFVQVPAAKSFVELDFFAILGSDIPASIALLIALNVRHSTTGLPEDLQLAIGENANTAVTNVEGTDAGTHHVVGDIAWIQAK